MGGVATKTTVATATAPATTTTATATASTTKPANVTPHTPATAKTATTPARAPLPATVPAPVPAPVPVPVPVPAPAPVRAPTPIAAPTHHDNLAERSAAKTQVAEIVDKYLQNLGTITTEEKFVVKEFENGLAAQKSQTRPSGAYRGIGVLSELVEDGAALLIKEVFAKNVGRFRKEFPPTKAGESYSYGGYEDNDRLEGQLICEVYDNAAHGWKKISDLTPQQIATIFHHGDNIGFKNRDNQVFVCEVRVPSVFVTKDCATASAAKQTHWGEKFSAAKHGLEAVAGGCQKSVQAAIDKGSTHSVSLDF